MDNLVGQQVGKYKLIRLLGRGGMAEVYEALQPGLERLVAIKILHRHQNIIPEMIDRFKREARSIAQLRHPNIVQVFDFDVENDLYYMVMERIPGEVLGLHLRHNGAMPMREAVLIAMQLADALDYAHVKGVIHRDIKPTNILFTDDRRKQIVLTDFGIALLTDATRLTMSTMMFGTPAYLSPEVGRGEQADERSDLYSLGIVLYEMVTGHIPFDADTTYGMIMQHIHQPLPPPRQFKADVPDVLERILYKTLAKNRNDRFQVARDLRNALQIALDKLEMESAGGDHPRLIALPAASPAPQKSDSRTRELPIMDSSILALLDESPQIDEKQIVLAQNNSLAVEASSSALTKRSRRPLRAAAALLMLGGTAFVGVSGFNVLGRGAGLNSPSVTATFMPSEAPSQTSTHTLTATVAVTATQTLTVTSSPSATVTATPTVTNTISAGVTRVRPNGSGPIGKGTETPTTSTPTGTLTGGASATPGRQTPLPTQAATSVPPTQIPPTSVPPTPVPPTQAPPQPTAVPPTNPPPAPTEAPIVPPIVSTLVPPIINTLLPGLPGL